MGLISDGKEGGDSQYSRWTGMEHVHDPATGQNYWVEAGRDWRENGPRGPGYYANGQEFVRHFCARIG